MKSLNQQNESQKVPDAGNIVGKNISRKKFRKKFLKKFQIFLSKMISIFPGVGMLDVGTIPNLPKD